MGIINRRSAASAAPMPPSEDELLVVERLALVVGKIPEFGLPLRCYGCVGWAMVIDVRRSPERGREADYHCPTCAASFTVRAAAIVALNRRVAEEMAAMTIVEDHGIPRPAMVQEPHEVAPAFEPRRPRKLSAPGATWSTSSAQLGAT